MTNPCCCSPTGGCTDEPCVPEEFSNRCTDTWYAEALYTQIANAFLANVQIDLGQINFRLAVPWKGVAFGCWDADETDTCCSRYSCDPCGGSSPDTMRMDCFSGPELSNFPDPSWRASIYRPNQFGTNCQGCTTPPVGYLTYGLPTIDQNWPRCNDCASRTPNDCTFYQQPMPDYYVIDPNYGLVYAAGPGDIIRQPAENGLPCCDEPPYYYPCGPGTPPPLPYRESLRFEDPPAPGVFRLLTIPGSPTPCEPAAFRDVYVRKELWIMPNLEPGAAGNCIRLLFRLQYQHTFLPIVPDIKYPGGPTPCSCSEIGLCYVLPTGDCDSRMVQSEGWYYMDIYGTDTLATVLNRPLRLFRVAHGGQVEILNCGVEAGVVAPLLPGFTGCVCIDPPRTCQAIDTTSCPNPPPRTDCQDFSGIGVAEVPCSPPNSGLFPTPPQNAHFDFPDRLWITT